MSWDCTIVGKNGNELSLDTPHYITGGTYGVSDNALYLNITWNYAEFYKKYGEKYGFKSLKELDKKSVDETLPLLTSVMCDMPYEEPSKDYWDNTLGNARKALCDLIQLGLLSSSCGLEGYWCID